MVLDMVDFSKLSPPGRGLNICKQRLKYGRRKVFFPTSKFEMAVNKVKIYGTPPKGSLWEDFM